MAILKSTEATRELERDKVLARDAERRLRETGPTCLSCGGLLHRHGGGLLPQLRHVDPYTYVCLFSNCPNYGIRVVR